MRNKIVLAIGAALVTMLIGGPVAAKEVVVTVDAKSMPWRSGPNPKLTFGLGDGRPPTLVWQIGLLPGLKLTISATGQTTTVAGGGFYGPEGQRDWIADRGITVLPSRFMAKSAGPVHLNQLVGCFVNADGEVIGKPFPIGRGAQVQIPEKASALSLGINDDRFGDNTGALTVTISVPEPKVSVEEVDDAR